jgi:hypothetical protein
LTEAFGCGSFRACPQRKAGFIILREVVKKVFLAFPQLFTSYNCTRVTDLRAVITGACHCFAQYELGDTIGTATVGETMFAACVTLTSFSRT